MWYEAIWTGALLGVLGAALFAGFRWVMFNDARARRHTRRTFAAGLRSEIKALHDLIQNMQPEHIDSAASAGFGDAERYCLLSPAFLPRRDAHHVVNFYHSAKRYMETLGMNQYQGDAPSLQRGGTLVLTTPRTNSSAERNDVLRAGAAALAALQKY